MNSGRRVVVTRRGRERKHDERWKEDERKGTSKHSREGEESFKFTWFKLPAILNN